RTADHLPVDPRRLVPLGAQHVQAARGDHRLGLLADALLVLDLLDHLPHQVARHVAAAGVLVGGAQARPRQRLGVAAQQDVGTATTHSLYTRRSSQKFWIAVPDMPDSFLYSLKYDW